MRTGLVALALLLAACGGTKDGASSGGGSGGGEGNGGGSGGQVCHPSGTALSIEAKSLTFFVDCLAAPAGEPFTIAFDNQESLPHNISIQSDTGALFVGDIITGPDTVTYEVDALEAGTYEFRCDVHPQMKGAFIVE